MVKPHKYNKTVGKRFAMLTVISHAGYSGKNLYYNVECDCGNKRRIISNSLHKVTSCGCASGEINPPLYEIPQELLGIKNKIMRDGKLLVFENGDIFRIKGKLFYRCTKNEYSRGGNYYCVSYTENGKQKHEYVHRLMAEAFIPNPENKKQVNHIDNNGHNNDLKNLEWVTDSENKKHARELLGNYSMKNAKPCIFCESKMTRSALQVCKSCSYKVKRLRNIEEKIKKLADKFSCVDMESLTIREKSIVSLTMQGRNHEQVADTHGISHQRVSQILQDILERNKIQEV